MELQEIRDIVQIDHGYRAYHITFSPSEARHMGMELGGPGHDLVYLIQKVNQMMPPGADDQGEEHVFHIGKDKYGCRLVHMEMEKNKFSQLTDEQWAAIRQGLQAVGEMFSCYNSLMMEEDSFHLVWRYEWS